MSNKNDMRGIRMILLIDTTNEGIGKKIASEDTETIIYKLHADTQ